MSKYILHEVPNSKIGWAGGYPLVKKRDGKVHALVGCEMTYRLLCGPADDDTEYTKAKLDCKRCKAIINKEARSR